MLILGSAAVQWCGLRHLGMGQLLLLGFLGTVIRALAFAHPAAAVGAEWGGRAGSVWEHGLCTFRSITFPSLPSAAPRHSWLWIVPGLQPAGPRCVIMLLLLIEDHLHLVI